MAYHLRKRRKAPRAPLNRPVELSVESKKHVGKGIEVGVGGMSIWCEKVYQSDVMVTLTFSLPGSARRITAMAKVAWIKAPAAGKKTGRMGVQFVALPREERDEIRSFVNRLAKNYRDLHIMLSMNKWKMERLKQLTSSLHLSSYRDIQELKRRVSKAMDGFRA
ncbi:MAG TPA: PilZ domain-containing protein [Myxococcota bacterium]|nr:PilZ domain-containing protein [Myxococcota bacterium]